MHRTSWLDYPRRFFVSYVLSHQFVSVQKTAKKPFRFPLEAVTCPGPACLPHTMKASHCPFLLTSVKQKAVNPNFVVFGLTEPGIEQCKKNLITFFRSPNLPDTHAIRLGLPFLFLNFVRTQSSKKGLPSRKYSLIDHRHCSSCHL